MKSPSMKYGTVSGSEKQVSRIGLGTMGHVLRPSDLSVIDSFYEAGGNCLDTARVYSYQDVDSSGQTENVVGHWMKSRGIDRDRLFIIGKVPTSDYQDLPGPYLSEDNRGSCNLDGIMKQVDKILECLQTDYLDMCMIHWDREDVPIDEIVDALNQVLCSGRARTIGGGNMTPQRFSSGNAYAAEKGLIGFTGSEVHFTLGVWNKPRWGDEWFETPASDPVQKNWYKESQMALFAWGSLANGFITGKFTYEDASIPEIRDNIAPYWFNDDNFERLKRAEKLAQEMGVDVLHVTLGYILCQPLNLYPLIGPRTSEELNGCLGALNVELTSEQLAWLNLETSI